MQLYYMDVLFKQYKGLAKMHVAMRTPSGEMKMPIGSEYLVKKLTKQGEQQEKNPSLYIEPTKTTGEKLVFCSIVQFHIPE